ncbi:MAG: glycosyltransferase family 39 protein, partial [Candidatus Rokubacteria bacterium]|nr:glycosyltransferase family 39 protein [Candidatus Rokubacteria bacterium]
MTEGVAHAPVALAAVGTVFFTVLFGRALFGVRVGVVAGLVLATSWGFVRHSQLFLPDMLVLCFATAAGPALWRARAAPEARVPLVAFWAAIGLAVFAKGPIGLLPVLAGAVWLWWWRGRREIRRLLSPLGLAAFTAITAVWLVPFLLLGGKSFGATVLWEDWLTWFFGVPRPLGMINLVIDALKGFLPWTPLLLLALPRIRQGWGDPAVAFAALWSAIPLGIMMLAANPMERYSLTFFPGAAVLTAWWLERHGATVTRAGRAVAVAGLAAGLAA